MGVVNTKTNRVVTLDSRLHGLIVRLGIMNLSTCFDGCLEEAYVVVICKTKELS